MAPRTTPSERRGMIALLAIMATVVSIMALRSVGSHGDGQVPPAAQNKQPLESVACKADHDTAPRHHSRRKAGRHRGHRTRNKRDKSMSHPAVNRSPLDEHNN